MKLQRTQNLAISIIIGFSTMLLHWDWGTWLFDVSWGCGEAACHFHVQFIGFYFDIRIYDVNLFEKTMGAL